MASPPTEVPASEKSATDAPLLEPLPTPPVVEAPSERSLQGDESRDATCCASGGVRRWWREWKAALSVMGLTVIAGATVNAVQPITPEMKKHYFGSDAKAAMVQSIIDCVVALLMLLSAGVYGRLLDSIGRRPFFLLATTCGIIPC